MAALKGLTAEAVPPLDGRARHGRHYIADDRAARQDAPRRRDGMGGMVGGPMIERTSVLAGNDRVG